MVPRHHKIVMRGYHDGTCGRIVGDHIGTTENGNRSYSLLLSTLWRRSEIKRGRGNQCRRPARERPTKLKPFRCQPEPSWLARHFALALRTSVLGASLAMTRNSQPTIAGITNEGVSLPSWL